MMSLQYGGQQLGRITVSLGGAVFPEHGKDVAGFLQAADATLYSAKQAGRNRVAVAAPTADEQTQKSL